MLKTTLETRKNILILRKKSKFKKNDGHTGQFDEIAQNEKKNKDSKIIEIEDRKEVNHTHT